MKRDEGRELVLEILEASLELQLRAIRQLRGTEPMPPPVRIRRGLRKQSLVALSVQLLEDEGGPLHLRDLVQRLLERFGRVTDRDSLSASLSKKADQKILIRKCGRGVFGLLQEGK
jgi:hypothetical protein